ncbi:MAG: superoxide dismutase [Candidatus Staskawiczbacteria bacterium RIFOXYB1_FULL_32_11]|uniref:Superoxide dismutase n=1 Tax=Candidatus Staskawiczbacteria bacterium RIFOXYD1_FULL_32_13 TaxID=1802234 RepID=A0A1G2JK10_9BACT|nr:MAG: Superoxide dismutase [Parcubacteria group bacterium GW2011_GWC2_32_10]OGZ79541.1 MAG: superoxide dismutase [Candidatus Staskawiczbacteria bacterium RIFOXYB1_FULL_32_11]OGZ80865.1 MAG: superoxide dismutase [Candidatus Staskawiczbacteria bacterium RIFOXYA2_FULL_32_7]OGZ86095.1 MAG: superoxide dismutase [Candidatus Staskawiczbacteria bacterium RIFOXYC2_FULL_32_10]OGZ87444.1 MAG: superoxide dismutase [Candidatus Staskawiczbacteria bacterium RIFOXYD1_FULL_32_13]
MEKYNLPNLLYEYNALEPYMSEQVLILHHTKHHQAYVNSANDLITKLEDARKNNLELDFKSISKALSFNIAGHILHEIFWKIMAPESSGKNKPSIKDTPKISEQIEKDFGGFDRFKKEFSETAKSVEGSGWALLTWHKEHGNLNIIQIEKHNVNLYPEQKILLALDVWEHSYYLDYKNDRAKFVENWWNIVNWQEVNHRFTQI